MKDVMLLHELGVPAIAPCSENLFLTEKQYNTLRPNFNHCVVLYDNDAAGLANLRMIKKQHPEVICTCIPRKYQAKDISDFYKMHGKRKTIELINKAKEYYINGGKERKNAEKSRNKREDEKEH
jgi:DNA primase